MLKRVIERYLRASIEREYEIPFRQLLWSMGYELLESSSTHHMFEFGKDIRAVHPDKSPRLWLFQTKSGDITQADWNEMERQLKLMLVMPTNHPNIQPGEPIQAVWVCNGNLTITVAPIMAQFNEEYIKQGYLPVEVWNINKLVDLFEEQFFNVNICPDEVVLDLISILASFNDLYFDLSKFSQILDRLLNDNLTQQSHRKIQKTLATAEIIVYYVFGRAYEVNNPYSAIEALEIAILRMWRFSKLLNFENDTLEILKGLQTLLIALIDDLLEDIEALIRVENGLFLNADGLAGTMLYPHRTFELLGFIGFRAWLANTEEDDTTFNQCVEYIEHIINNNPSSSHPIWERAQEDILITAFILWKAGKTQVASSWIEKMAKWIATIYTQDGGLARPGANTRDVIKQLLGVHLSFTTIEPVNTSYLCYAILELCYWFDLSDIYSEFYEQVKNIRWIEFQFESEESIYENELVGVRDQVVPPAKWTEFKSWYYNRYHPSDPMLFPQGIDARLADNLWILLIVASHFGNRSFTFMFRRDILNMASN